MNATVTSPATPQAPSTAPAVADQLFDHYAATYDVVLNNALAPTGEDKNYFARTRVRFLRDYLSRVGALPNRAMDFGCGIGSAATHLLEAFDLQRLLGVDVSSQSIHAANEHFADHRVRFHEIADFTPDASFDLVYCSSVFHHIPLDQRRESIQFISDSLRPGGILSLWEHNPWNPGTRYAMYRCEFDQDAITLTPPSARRLVQQAGLEIIRTDFLFIFPRFLKGLRWIEPRVAGWPVGGQYQVLARKPV